MMKATSKLKLGGVAVLLIGIFAVLNLTGLANPIKGFFYSVSAPVQENLWQAGANVSGFFQAIFGRQDLKKENDDLKKQNQELSAKITMLSELKNENESLRNALEIGLEKDFRLVFGQIISKEAGADIVLINKGAKDGMSPGMPVISEQKILVGQITEVLDNFSKVMLITDKNSSFNAKILDTGIEGVLVGQGNFGAALDLLPKNIEIGTGGEVVTSVLGGIFPAGLLIGRITEIEKNDVESFQKAKIQPSANIGELNNLFIIVSHDF